jgi:hypothetical protein
MSALIRNRSGSTCANVGVPTLSMRLRKHKPGRLLADRALVVLETARAILEPWRQGRKLPSAGIRFAVPYKCGSIVQSPQFAPLDSISKELGSTALISRLNDTTGISVRTARETFAVLCLGGAHCLAAPAIAGSLRTTYDGSWALNFVAQRGACNRTTSLTSRSRMVW